MRRSLARVLVLAALVLSSPTAATADLGDCGQPQSTGATPKTSDALAALKSAVGSPSACDAEPCTCDVNASGGVNTTDALRILRVAVGQEVPLECDCGCTLVGGSPPASATAAPRGLQPTQQQIQIDVKLIEMTQSNLAELSFDWLLSSKNDVAVEPGGTSGYDTNVAVSSNATGGPANVPYLLYSAHRAEGALPILNKNFVSPFSSIKTLFLLPTGGCVVFPDAATSVPQNHPGGAPVENVAPDDGGYGNVDAVAHQLLTPQQFTTMLATLQAQGGNETLTAPTVRVHSGQSVFHMIDDIEPDVDDFTSPFRTRIQAVTMMPFGNFTGPALDIEPEIADDGVSVRMRLGTQLATFFFSTAFQVDGTPTDAEIPLHKRSTTSATFHVSSGETLLIGGLRRTGNPTVEKGLPVLSDVPLIGSMFTRKHLNANNRLVVFVTPTIVDAD